MDELSCWLALARAPTSNRFKLELLERCSSVTALFKAGNECLEANEFPAALRRYFRSPDRDAVRRDRYWLESAGCSVVYFGHPEYPPLLAAIDDAPTVLYVRGDVAALSMPHVAVVGSRNPTPSGREHAAAFARALAELKLGVTSGLAIGIDAAAHAAALATGGVTVAVTGNGLDKVYPAANARLAEEICAHGALVSEFPPGAPPRAQHFPRRNRLISGLSLGVLVVEATLKSGSLITARLAGDQGREVFALPGSIDNPLSKGCHRLLRDGAKLVESVADIVSEIAPMLVPIEDSGATSGAGERKERASDCVGSASERGLLRALGHDPASVDTLIERTGLTAEEVSSILLALEMQGYVSSLPGGLYSRATGRH
jgi:DNA processing protein